MTGFAHWVHFANPVILSSGFTDYGLFANGATGALYDAEDLSSMFLEPEGQTEVSAADDGVGRHLDKSQMAGITAGAFITAQPELMVNGDFSSSPATGWSVIDDAGGDAEINVVDGEMVVTGSDTKSIEYEISDLIAGVPCRIAHTVPFPSGNLSGHNIKDVAGGGGNNLATLGPFTDTSYVNYFTPAGTSAYWFPRRNGSSTFKLDDLSVKAVPGNHAVQETGAAVPLYKADGSLKYDGYDDCSPTPVLASTANTLAVKFTAPSSAASAQVIAGLRADASTGLYLAIDTSGNLCAGVGTDGIATIKRTGSIFNETGVAVLVHDGDTVWLYWEGVEGYSDDQNGAPSTTVPLNLGALNNNGTAASFFGGNISKALPIDVALTATQVQQLTNYWSS